MSKVVYKASCWDCDDFYIGKTKRRLHDRKTEHFKALAKSCHTSAIADHITSTGHNIRWDHFDILATGRSDLHCKIKETLLIRELQPALNENVGSEKLFLYKLGFVCFADFILKSVCLYNISFSLLGTSLSRCVYICLYFFPQRSLLKMYVEAYETLSL